MTVIKTICIQNENAPSGMTLINWYLYDENTHVLCGSEVDGEEDGGEEESLTIEQINVMQKSDVRVRLEALSVAIPTGCTVVQMRILLIAELNL